MSPEKLGEMTAKALGWLALVITLLISFGLILLIAFFDS